MHREAIMILPYYKIEKTEEGKQFFYAHRGYFNFWDEYLIMNIDEGYNKIFFVLVNRTGRKFSYVKEPDDYKAAKVSYITESIQERKPEEMFDDFPELKNIILRGEFYEEVNLCRRFEDGDS